MGRIDFIAARPPTRVRTRKPRTHSRTTMPRYISRMAVGIAAASLVVAVV
jgi:hypothetical protein